jgi:hypothetical protein
MTDKDATIAKLREENEALRLDAARYRWVRKGAWRESKPDPGTVRLSVTLEQGDWPGEQSALVDFDMAIDAALAASSTERAGHNAKGEAG